MPLEIAFMKFSYAIMIFDIMLFEFHSRETVIIEISFGVKQSFRHGTQKPKFDFRFGMALRNQYSTSGLAGKARWN